MNIFLFVTVNEHEREAYEAKFIRQKSKCTLGKIYYLGLLENGYNPFHNLFVL